MGGNFKTKGEITMTTQIKEQETFLIKKGNTYKEVENPHMLIGPRGNLICIGTYKEVNNCFAERVHKLREMGLLNDIDDLSFVPAPKCQDEINKIMTSPLYASRFREQPTKHLYWK